MKEYDHSRPQVLQPHTSIVLLLEEFISLCPAFLFVCSHDAEVTCDPRTTFDCSRGNKLNCIDIRLVCNGVDDCGSAEDEATHLCVNQSKQRQLNLLCTLDLIWCLYLFYPA